MDLLSSTSQARGLIRAAWACRASWCLALAAVVLSACGGLPVAGDKVTGAALAQGHGRAIGHMVLVQDGVEIPWKKRFEQNGISVYVRSARTGRMHNVLVTEVGGAFAWPLEPGDYVLVAYLIGPPRTTGRVWAAFSIPQAGQSAYIGDLRIEVVRASSRITLEDHFDDALKTIDTGTDSARMPPVKSLMTLEGQPGSFSSVWPICAESGGLRCGPSFQGVEPLQPPGTANAYPLTASLAPLLEWKPSGKAGITYDLAVYESLALIADLPGMPRARGALVAYAEGLREPRYPLAEPLQPDRKYEWTVRLRDGDTVSTWSETSYFAFLLVGWASGRGQWFGFTTPAR